MSAPRLRVELAVPGPRTQFVVGALLLGGSFLAGLSLRAPIYGEPAYRIALSGPMQFFPNTLPGLLSVAGPMAVAVAAYLWCLQSLQRGFTHSLWITLAMSVVAIASALPSSPLSSPDAAHSAADVRTLWYRGVYPASREGVPSRLGDPVSDEVQIFSHSPSGYGPVTYVVGGLALPFVGDGFRANVFGVKAVAALFLIGCAAATGWLAQLLGRDAALGVGMVGLHPLFLWEYAAGGHNDTIMAAFGVLAVALFVVGSARGVAGGLLAAVASVLSKFAVAAAAPLLVVWWFPRLRPAAAVTTAAATVGLVTFFVTVKTATGGPALSVSTPTVWGALADPLGGTDHMAEVFFFAFGLAASWLVLRHPLRTPAEFIHAAGLLLFLLVFALPSYHPWYQIWYFPFAALAFGASLRNAALLFSLGAFVPLFAFHWRVPLEDTLRIPDPMHTFAVLLWGAGLVVLIAPWSRGGGSAPEAVSSGE